MPGMLVEDASENGERVGSREQPQQANNKSNMKSVSFQEELWASTDLLFQTKVTWLLVLGPIAVVGGLTESLGPATLFAFSGMALIPCAERLSFITEQVAEHTNGTIGALLNATFGNAPELLISISALRSGYYRVVQLAMLGSMLTNMLLVFGVACVIGGMRWQVQELRITSGNVSMVMLLVATAGSLFPAALVLSGQLSTKDVSVDVPTQEEITFCRLNAFVMLFLYLCYLVFQLGTHKEEFDDEALEGPAFRRARRNLFCLRLMGQAHTAVTGEDNGDFVGQELPLLKARTSDRHIRNTSSDDESLGSSTDGFDNHGGGVDSPDDDDHWIAQEEARQKMRRKPAKAIDRAPPSPRRANRNKSKNSDGREDDDGYESGHPIHQSGKWNDENSLHREWQGDVFLTLTCFFIAAPLISMRVGIFWLFIITLCISAMSDILVDTIDGFARKMHISEVFTSMVIMPVSAHPQPDLLRVTVYLHVRRTVL
jgi:Ca2+/H+ antiporter